MDTHGEDILGIHRRVMGSLDKLHLLKNGKSFKFHVQQCQNLCNYILDKLSPYIDKNEEYLVGNVWTESVQKAWKEIYRALKEAETYLNHCSTDSSFIECFIMSNTGEAFALHMHDLAWSLLCLDLTLLCPIDAWNDRINLEKFRKRISVFFAEMSVLHLEQFGFKFQDYWHLLMACNQTAAKAWSFKKNKKIRVLQFMERKMLETIRNECKIKSATGISTWLQIPPKDLIKKKSIGEGSSGQVYEGSWLGYRVAIKDIPIDARDLFDTETKVLAKLESPFIVQMIGTCIEGSHCYIVMELVGSSLDKLLRNSGDRATLALPVAVDMMLQISRGMEYLHRHGIMHMDLKASNVLIEPSAVPELRKQGYGRVKLCDFGMASLRLCSSRQDDPKGTCYWRAPEAFPIPNLPLQAIDSLEEYTHKADVYSFAMTCYEILTGEQPFLGVLPKDLYPMIVGGERPTLRQTSCPAVLADHIATCWETYPMNRPCFAQVSTFMRKMKSFILGWNNPGKVLLEPVRSKEEAFDEIPADRKLMSITKVLHIVPPKIIRRYDLNLSGLMPPEESNAQGGHFTPLFQNMKDVLLPSSVVVVEKDSLHYLLNTENGFLTWDWRMKIAYDVASGLALLHDSGLIHGHVNSSNVLLPDEINRRTRLADSCSAGLVKNSNVLLPNEINRRTRLAHSCSAGLVKNSDSGMKDLDKYSSGSWGYMAPKQFYSRKISKSLDVYSFGVLLLELLTGKDPIKASTHLPKLIFSIDDERWAMEMLDKRLGSYMDIPNVLAMYSIAKQCTSLHEYSRPRMFEVVTMIANSSKVSKESTTNVTFDKNWASLENEIPFTNKDIHKLFDTEQPQFEESLDREQLQEFDFEDLYEESLDIEQPQEYSFQDLYEESYFQDLHDDFQFCAVCDLN